MLSDVRTEEISDDIWRECIQRVYGFLKVRMPDRVRLLEIFEEKFLNLYGLEGGDNNGV